MLATCGQLAQHHLLKRQSSLPVVQGWFCSKWLYMCGFDSETFISFIIYFYTVHIRIISFYIEFYLVVFCSSSWMEFSFCLFAGTLIIIILKSESGKSISWITYWSACSVYFPSW